MTISEIIAILCSVIGVLGSATAIYFAFHNNKKTDLNEFKKEVEEKTVINVKLDSIVSDIADIKTDMKDTKQEVKALAEKFAVLDNSVKTAHKRIDGVEERLNKLEE